MMERGKKNHWGEGNSRIIRVIRQLYATLILPQQLINTVLAPYSKTLQQNVDVNHRKQTYNPMEKKPTSLTPMNGHHQTLYS